MNNYPTHLYKFRSLSDDVPRQMAKEASHQSPKDYVKRIILNNEIYFPSPDQFNDPYDCLPKCEIYGTIKEFRHFVEGFYAEKIAGMSRNDRRKFISDRVKELTKGLDKQKAINDIISDIRTSVGVCSLSAKYDHILMWTHYADTHKGLCLRFRADQQEPIFNGALEVGYDEKRQTLNPLKDDKDERLRKTIFCKARFWKYEAEWRSLNFEHGPGTNKFEPKLLDGIIFGIDISDEDRTEVISWLAVRTTPVELFQASIDNDEYKIKISPYQ